MFPLHKTAPATLLNFRAALLQLSQCLVWADVSAGVSIVPETEMAATKVINQKLAADVRKADKQEEVRL
jgi:hypothetical protein